MSLGDKKLAKVGKKKVSGKKRPSHKKGSTKSNLGKVNRVTKAGGR